MTKQILCYFIVFICHSTCYSQTVFGNWKTFDVFDSTKEEAIVKIYKERDSLYIKIIDIIPIDHKNDLCTKCSNENKNKPIKGMVILKAAYLKDGVWQGTKILDPKTGYLFGCKISLKSDHVLKVRGFLGYSFFGKNVYWQRVK